jgi:hypothetical protein
MILRIAAESSTIRTLSLRKWRSWWSAVRLVLQRLKPRPPICRQPIPQKADPSLRPASPKYGGKEKARDFVRDDTRFAFSANRKATPGYRWRTEVRRDEFETSVRTKGCPVR